MSFDDPVAGTVAARLYYPAAGGSADAAPDLSSGPYPLAVFLHGWLGAAWMYDGICTALASHGYLVVSLDTETGALLDMEDFADDGVAALHWAEALSEGDGPFSGAVSEGDWVALGHSMGGATLARLIALEPRVRVAVAFMPYEGAPSFYDAVGDFDGSLLILSGTADGTAPPPQQRQWFEAADGAARSLLVEFEGMGHQAVTDLPFGEVDPMPHDQQTRIVSALATAFVRAERGGDESLWSGIVGPGPDGFPVRFWSRSHAPALWTSLGDGRLSLGVAALPGAGGEVLLGSAPGEEGLLDAVPIADLSLGDGIDALELELPSWDGDLWVAARIDSEEDGERWTRSVPVAMAGTTPTAGTSEGALPSEVAPEAGAGRCGCAARPGGAWGWSVALLWARRRSDGRR